MKRLVLRTVLPAFLAIVLFTGMVFLYLIPSFSQAIMDQKRLMIRELTESSWNILARFEAEERSGVLTREQAQEAAISHVRSLHYGQQQKDYFWINNMEPTMIVHPHRPDLEGADLSLVADPDGKLMFVEMVEVVKKEQAGYVSYMWQWKDDSEKIVPKISYVKGFQPWGWIIGTGVYTEDVNSEVGAITDRLQGASLLIICAVALLLYLLLRTSFQSEKGRQKAAAALVGSEEKYRSLVESAGESIMMVLGDERLFANPSMLHLLGYNIEEFAALEIDTVILPSQEETAAGKRHWQAITDGESTTARYEARLVCKDDSNIRVSLSLSRIQIQGRIGFMAVASQLTPQLEININTAETADQLADANRRVPVMASLMLSHGAEAMDIVSMLSTNADTVLSKSVDLVMAEIGPAPCKFDFLLMGSLGRNEYTLFADQDNAIVYEDVGPKQQEEVAEYFQRLGSRVSVILDSAGYPFCEGEIMAGNSKWCLPLAQWRSVFSKWIHTLEAEDLLKASIFFDFRSGLNQSGLVFDLKEHLLVELGHQRRFFFFMARNVLLYEPPLNAFGSFKLEEHRPTHATFDSKGVIAQIVDYVRLRALQNNITECSTLGRLQALEEVGALTPRTVGDTASAFVFLTSLRIRHQAKEILDRMEPNNRIEPAILSEAEQAELKDIFNHIKALQSGLDHEFSGS